MYQWRLLKVNLTTGDIRREVLPAGYTQKYLGGRVLGDILLYNEVAPGTDPLSPGNKLFFGTGPLTGTGAPGSSRYIVHTKSPLTGLYLNALAGGYFAPELRKTGFDTIIIEGKSEYPVYLTILNGEATLRDARALWGMTTDNTQEFIKEELNDSKVRIACIGPAGENLVPYAAIVSERRAAARGGGGAVMGSKNLKAIAVRGTKEVHLADPAAFRSALKDAMQSIENNPITSKFFPLYGTLQSVPVLNEAGIIPWRNWQEAASIKGGELSPQAWREQFVKKDIRCAPPCNVKCSKLSLATEGRHAGIVTEGPDYETEYAFGACCGITDISAIVEADSLCDRYGLDTISTGVCLAFAMECFEKGIINKGDTAGVELSFGDSQPISGLIHDTAYRRGFGEILSLGVKKMAEKFGRGSEQFAMHVKGMELGGYDPRGAKSVALVFACGPRGGCHKSGGSSNGLSAREVNSGNARFSTEGKAALAKASRENRVLADTAIMCIFPQIAIKDDTMAGMLSAATGVNYTTSELYTIAERGSNIERAFNVREGLRRGWDTLPPRLLTDSMNSGPTRGQVVELDRLINDFYKICQWDLTTGIPLPVRLKELGLHEIAADMQKYLNPKAVYPA